MYYDFVWVFIVSITWKIQKFIEFKEIKLWNNFFFNFEKLNQQWRNIQIFKITQTFEQSLYSILTSKGVVHKWRHAFLTTLETPSTHHHVLKTYFIVVEPLGRVVIYERRQRLNSIKT